MDSETILQGNCTAQESGECNKDHDDIETSNKGAKIEHVTHSAERDGTEDRITWGDGIECSKEGTDPVFDGNKVGHSDTDKPERDKILGSSGMQAERTEGNRDQHVEREARDLYTDDGLGSVQSVAAKDGMRDKEPELSSVKNNNVSCHTSATSDKTQSGHEIRKVEDDLPHESKAVDNMEEVKVMGDIQGFRGCDTEIVSDNKAVLEKELDENARSYAVSISNQAVGDNFISSIGEIEQEAVKYDTGIENKGEIDNDKSDEKMAKYEDRNVTANGKMDESVKSVAKDSSESEWLDLLGNGLLKKKIIVKGKGPETRPKPGNEVTMIINGELMDGTKLKEDKVVFIHDDRELIQAFELAVALMELGEKAILYTDAKYAYGPFGCESLKIPKNCSITYILEIVSIMEGPDKDKLRDDERVNIGDKKRAIGNGLYSRGDYGSAIDCYKRALKYLDGSANKDVIDMKVKCQNNLSAAQLKVNAHQAALQSCNIVLALQPQNIKAIFRKSKCLEALGRQDEALKCLKEASMIDPDNKMVYNDLMRLSKYMKKSRQKESDMYKRMVGGMKKKDDIEGKNKDNILPLKVMIGTLVVAGLGILTAFMWNRH